MKPTRIDTSSLGAAAAVCLQVALACALYRLLPLVSAYAPADTDVRLAIVAAHSTDLDIAALREAVRICRCGVAVDLCAGDGPESWERYGGAVNDVENAINELVSAVEKFGDRALAA